MKTNQEIMDTLNSGLIAKGIRYVQPKMWQKQGLDRIYFQVGSKSDGFIELKTATIEMHGVSRLQLCEAVQEILNLKYIPGAKFYEGAR